jgi:hypothetical protein
VESADQVGNGSQSFPFAPAMEITQGYDADGAVAQHDQPTREEMYQQTEEEPVLSFASAVAFPSLSNVLRSPD